MKNGFNDGFRIRARNENIWGDEKVSSPKGLGAQKIGCRKAPSDTLNPIEKRGLRFFGNDGFGVRNEAFFGDTEQFCEQE